MSYKAICDIYEATGGVVELGVRGSGPVAAVEAQRRSVFAFAHAAAASSSLSERPRSSASTTLGRLGATGGIRAATH